MELTAIPRAQIANARALLAELIRQSDTGKPGPYVSPDGNGTDDKGDLTSVVIDGRVDLIALASVVETAIRKDRTELFGTLDALTDKICKALEVAPYNVAAPAIRDLEEIMSIVSDPLGDHFGTCILCEEPIFVRGQPDDDCEAAGDEYVHRTCGDRWRTEHPGEHTRIDDGGGE